MSGRKVVITVPTKPLSGSYVVVPYSDGQGWRLQPAGSRQTIASCAHEDREALMDLARMLGAKQVEVLT